MTNYETILYSLFYFSTYTLLKIPKRKMYSKFFNTIKQLQNHGLVDKKIYQSTETNWPTNRLLSSFDNMIGIYITNLNIFQMHFPCL